MRRNDSGEGGWISGLKDLFELREIIYYVVLLLVTTPWVGLFFSLAISAGVLCAVLIYRWNQRDTRPPSIL